MTLEPLKAGPQGYKVSIPNTFIELEIPSHVKLRLGYRPGNAASASGCFWPRKPRSGRSSFDLHPLRARLPMIPGQNGCRSGWPHGLLEHPDRQLLNTVVLITSSVTAVMVAWIAPKQNRLPVLPVTMAVTVPCVPLGFWPSNLSTVRSSGHYVIQRWTDGLRITGHLRMSTGPPCCSGPLRRGSCETWRRSSKSISQISSVFPVCSHS